MDIHLETKKDKLDIDDPYKKDKYPATLDMWVRFDCFTRNIFIDIHQHDDGKNLRTTVELKPETLNVISTDIDNNKKSSYTISTDDICGISTNMNSNESSSFYVSSNLAKLSSTNNESASTLILTPTDITIKTDGDFNIDAKGSVNIKSSNDIILEADGDINQTHK